jgi:prephenate dehydrogenase
VAAVRAEAPPDALARYVPAHPLAGAETGGWAASTATLLDGAVWAVCPDGTSSPHPEALAQTADVLDALDSWLVICTSDEHDQAVGHSSHAAHLVAQALSAGIADPLVALLSGGALRDATRVAAADARLWSDVLALNRASTLAAIEALERRLAALADALRRDEAAELRRLWQQGERGRRRLEQSRWGAHPWIRAELPTAETAWLTALGPQGVLIRRLRLTGAIWTLDVAPTAPGWRPPSALALRSDELVEPRHGLAPRDRDMERTPRSPGDA